MTMIIRQKANPTKAKPDLTGEDALEYFRPVAPQPGAVQPDGGPRLSALDEMYAYF